MKQQLSIRVMLLTVREIIEMIDNGKLFYDTTTQRQFIYGDTSITKKVSTDFGTTSKAGYVLYNVAGTDSTDRFININLPPVLFWDNTDTGKLNIHDGKQRLLSLYYFVKGIGNVSTYIDKESISSFDALSTEDQEYILNYKVGVQITTGTSSQEEDSFFEINSNSVNLTDYENLHAVMYGTWMTGFEEYLEKCNLTNITAIGRGEQAYPLLLAMHRINDSKQAGTRDSSDRKLRDLLRPKRDLAFDPTFRSFDDLLKMTNELLNIKFTSPKKSQSLSLEIALKIASYSIDNFPGRLQDIINLYIRAGKQVNDIPSWSSDFNNNNLQTHKTFINAYVNDGLELDPKRYFDDSQLSDIITRDGCRCAHVDAATGEQCTETNLNKLEVDHIIPWSTGGRTVIANGQLLCKTHNTSKGNRA